MRRPPADLIPAGADRFRLSSRERFLTELTLDHRTLPVIKAGVPLLDENYLILSTIHSAKAQEWKSVFLLNASDGCLPSDLGTGSADFYMWHDRAKDNLHLIVPQRFFHPWPERAGDRHVYASRTAHSGWLARLVSIG